MTGAELSTDPLVVVAVQTERHVAAGGWDQPARLFALVPTAQLIAHQPQLAATLGADPADRAPGALTAVEQDGMPPTVDLGSQLARIGWPETVLGAALAVERMVLPPEAQQQVHQAHGGGPGELEALAARPDRRDVRLLVAVLRDGRAICLLRQRDHDRDDQVATGPDLAPGLVAALRHTFDGLD
jgi:hypothetical protein